MIQEYKQISM